MKKILFLVIVFFSFALFSCQKQAEIDDENIRTIGNYYLESILLFEGQSFHLVHESGEIKGFEMVVADENIAKIDNKKAIAISEGETTIEYLYKGKLCNQQYVRVVKRKTAHPENNNSEVVAEFLAKYNSFVSESQYLSASKTRPYNTKYYYQKDPFLLQINNISIDEYMSNIAIKKEDEIYYIYIDNSHGLTREQISDEEVMNYLSEMNNIKTGGYSIVFDENLFSKVEIVKSGLLNSYKIRGTCEDFGFDNYILTKYDRLYPKVENEDINLFLEMEITFINNQMLIQNDYSFETSDKRLINERQVDNDISFSLDKSKATFNAREDSNIPDNYYKYPSDITKVTLMTDYTNYGTVYRQGAHIFYKTEFEGGVYAFNEFDETQFQNIFSIQLYDLEYNKIELEFVLPYNFNYYRGQYLYFKINPGTYYVEIYGSTEKNHSLRKVELQEIKLDDTNSIEINNGVLYHFIYESDDDGGLLISRNKDINSVFIYKERNSILFYDSCHYSEIAFPVEKGTNDYYLISLNNLTFSMDFYFGHTGENIDEAKLINDSFSEDYYFVAKGLPDKYFKIEIPEDGYYTIVEKDHKNELIGDYTINPNGNSIHFYSSSTSGFIPKGTYIVRLSGASIFKLIYVRIKIVKLVE